MRIIYPLLVFIGLTLLILPVAVPIIKTSAEFSMFSPRWDGCTEFARLVAENGRVVPLMYPYNSVRLGELDGVLMIIGPDVEFSALEASEVRAFLDNGGTLFIADDFGTANGLLSMLGVKARFSKQPLKDLFYSKRSEFPVVVRINDPSLAEGVERITLNIPSAITGSEGVILTSKVSAVGKAHKSYPIMTELKYGNGRIILLSDPDILTNDMFGENRKFIENLVRYLGTGTFYFDEAHHSDFNPYSLTTVYIHRELDRARAFQVFLAVAALAVVVESGVISRIINVMMGLFPRREENILDDLPEWVDADLLERMINEIKTGSKLGDTYGREGVYGKAERRD
ncbi:DUF4350 domain-containing protein [Geoglobus acetivorans]|uniref:DUF4350 domain-containing protein n=1 Tax=Geoglobus acetivorans TaxID=565033 RepID=A0ABZ3H3D8_GEOAI|nr:DUF4350 domain-containing protein [Geoglobus acetivorans]